MIRSNSRSEKTSVTLKTLAHHVGLSTGTISIVLNRRPQSSAIPQQTQERIFAAARELNYQPNPVARALAIRRSVSARTAGHSSNDARALLFAGAEEFARAMQAIKNAGLEVPRDVSVIGVGELVTA